MQLQSLYLPIHLRVRETTLSNFLQFLEVRPLHKLYLQMIMIIRVRGSVVMIYQLTMLLLSVYVFLLGLVKVQAMAVLQIFQNLLILHCVQVIAQKKTLMNLELLQIIPSTLFLCTDGSKEFVTLAFKKLIRIMQTILTP